MNSGHRVRAMSLSAPGKQLSGDELQRMRDRLIDRLQWCPGDERKIIVDWLSDKGLLKNPS